MKTYLFNESKCFTTCIPYIKLFIPIISFDVRIILAIITTLAFTQSSIDLVEITGATAHFCILNNMSNLLENSAAG